MALARKASRVLAALAFLVALVAAAVPASGFTPPKLQGYVVDTAGALTGEERAALDTKLDAVRRRTGFAVVAFVVGSLEGEPIDDVAYATFNAWGVGEKALDNGVLLVIAPNERKTRIETGKGVGGALTDLQSNDILRELVIPSLRENRVYEAVDQGTTAIARTLAGEAAGGPQRRVERGRPAPREPPSLFEMGAVAGGIVLVIVLAVVSPAFRSLLWFFLLFFTGGGRGGGGGFGGGGGSGYSGGGGTSGGGGSSEDY